MREGPDRTALLDVFLREAWETMWTLAAGARQLAAGTAVAGLHDDLPIFAHRLRGSAALYGFSGLSELAGLVEDILTRLRGAAPDERRRASELLGAFVESLRQILKKIETRGVEDSEAIAVFRARHAAAVNPRPPATPAAAAAMTQALAEFLATHGDLPAYFRSEALEHLDTITCAMAGVEQADHDADAVPTALRALHTLKGAAYTVGCTPVGDLAHRLEDLLIDVRDTRSAISPRVVEGIAAGVAALRCMISLEAGARDRLPTILEHALTALHMAIGSAPVLPPPQSAGGHRHDASPVVPPTVRIPVECLDVLLDLVGEFVVTRSRLDQRLAELTRIDELLSASAARMTRVAQDCEANSEASPGGARPSGLRARAGLEHPTVSSLTALFEELEFERYTDVEVLVRSLREIGADVSEIRRQLRRALGDLSNNVSSAQRLVQSLRNEVTRARMVPVGRLFERFPGQVVETARVAGKTVVLKMGGTGVEVDSAIIEQLADPLLHLVQNAIVHGLETEDERRAAGKPIEGTLHLRASHESGAVLIEVEDDGRGIDVEGLRTHAMEQGLIGPHTGPLLSEHEIVNLIFLPGVTTASELTTVSGRGLGLDVVRTNVARVNGDVEVTTQRGVGTRFRLKIPLTVLIVDALVVGAGGETFAVPLNKVSHVVTVTPERIQSAGDKELVWVRDQLLDLVRLDRVLALPVVATHRDIPLLVVRAEARLVAVAVTDVRGKEEIVIKGLGGFPDGLGPFSSGTICADGRVMLVLNLARLLQLSGNPSSPAEVRGRPVPGGPPSAGQRPHTKANRRFLLVDDSISVRKYVGQMLERSGFDVVTASNGVEALQQVENTAIHAVITDLEMPNGHGYELIETLRRRPSTRNLPIVILTTRSGDKHHDLARRLGVDHYLTKPVDEAAFTALMGSLVAQHRPAATGPDGT